MAGEQQGHHFVADLLVVEAVAILVGRIDQQAEHVLAAFAASPATPDLLEDDAVERAPGLLHLGERTSWAPQHLQPVSVGPEAKPLLEVARDVQPRVSGVGIKSEQCPHGDPQGEPPRPAIDVDSQAVAPAVQGTVDLRVHRGKRGGDRLVVERGQHDSPRAVVKLPVDRQQPVPQQRRQVAHVPFAVGEVGRVRDEHVVICLGADHEHAVAVKDAHREHGAKALVGVQQCGQRMVCEGARAPDAEPFLPGRKGNLDTPLGEQVVRQAPHRIEGHRCWTHESHEAKRTRRRAPPLPNLRPAG